MRQERAKEDKKRRKYQEIFLPLYEASIRCDWKAAEAILDKNSDMNLLRCRITENGDTALHIAASAKAPKRKVDEFVKNLVERMENEDLLLVNNNHSTTLFLAAVAGNIEAVKIMMEKNPALDTIPGGGKERMMPLYAAVLFGNKDVAEYLYECSDNLYKGGWNDDNRQLLLEKCVESDMFDIALKILGTGHYACLENIRTLFGLLARKPEAFHEKKSSNTESNIIKRTVNSDIAIQIAKKYLYLGRSINLFGLLARKLEVFHEKKSSNTESNEAFHETKSSNTESDEAFYQKKSPSSFVSAFYGNKAGTPVEKNDALLLLRLIWDIIDDYIDVDDDIDMDDILRGPPDSIKSGFGRIHQTMQLKELICRHLDKLDEEVKEIKNQEREIEKEEERERQRQREKEEYFYKRKRERQRQREKETEDEIEREDLIFKREMEIEIQREIDRESQRRLQRTLRECERRNGEDDVFQTLKDLVSKYVEDMHVETRSLIKQENTTDEDQALDLQKLISEYIVKLHDETKNIPTKSNSLNWELPVQRLQNLISDHIKRMRAETEIIDTRSYSSRVLFIAAEVGNINFLLELFRRSPDLIWKVNDNNQTIFHVAVKHRQEGIYNLLYEIGAMKDMVTPLIDKDGNNMLHLAAMSTIKKNLEDVSGAALRMQRELLWFEEVEHMIPPSSRVSKNKDGFTPRELFTMEHQHLIDQAEKWMKETASQCMVVAALIATIVFAAAFTVPGGYNQNDGIPMFKRKLSFVAFVVADAISLFLSSASILTFLSILTSRYAERDFVAALPMKLMLGLVTLFLSIGTMMVTFSVSFFVLYHKEMKWIPIFISGFAVIPAILYVVLQFHLLVDVVRSTYGGKYLFEPKKQVLFYYEKPQDPQNLTQELEDPQNLTQEPEDPQDLTHITSEW